MKRKIVTSVLKTHAFIYENPRKGADNLALSIEEACQIEFKEEVRDEFGAFPTFKARLESGDKKTLFATFELSYFVVGSGVNKSESDEQAKKELSAWILELYRIHFVDQLNNDLVRAQFPQIDIKSIPLTPFISSND